MGARQRAVRYVHRHPASGRLIFRRAVPAKLRPFVSGNPREHIRTLAAKNIGEPGALERYKAALGEYDNLVAVARKALSGAFDHLDRPTLQWATEKYRIARLDRDDAARRSGKPIDRELIEANQDGFKSMLDDAPPAVVRSAFEEDATELLGSAGLRVDPSSDEFLQLCYSLLAVAIETSDAQEARAAGRFIPTPPEPVVPLRKLSDPKPAPSDGEDGATFRSLAFEVMDTPRYYSPSSREAIATALRFFTDATGDLRPKAITRLIVSEFVGLLAKRPSRLSAAERKMPFREINDRYASRPDIPRMKAKTQAIHIQSLATLWAKLQDAGRIMEDHSNPFRGRHGIQPASRPEIPQQFSTAELNAIFALPVFTAGERPAAGKGEASYWLPLILLFTGARPEEAAQLLVSDFAQETEGTHWLMRYTDEGDHPTKGPKSLKTARHGTGRRKILVHPRLIDLGLLAYLKSLKASGQTALFPTLRPTGKKRLLFAKFGEWWSGYLRSHGVLPHGERRQPSRGFRHNFTSECRRAGVSDAAARYIVGHSVASDVHSGYGSRETYGLEIDKVAYPHLDLSKVALWSA